MYDSTEKSLQTGASPVDMGGAVKPHPPYLPAPPLTVCFFSGVMYIKTDSMAILGQKPTTQVANTKKGIAGWLELASTSDLERAIGDADCVTVITDHSVYNYSTILKKRLALWTLRMLLDL